MKTSEHTNVTSLIPNYFVFSSREVAARFCNSLDAVYFPGYKNYTAYIHGEEVLVSWLSLN